MLLLSGMRLKLYNTQFKLAWQDALEYRLNTLVFFGIAALGVISMYFLWGEVFSDRVKILGYTRNEIITYYIMVTYVINTSFAGNPIGNHIRTGQLSSVLAEPVNYLWLTYLEGLGNRLFRLLVGLPVVVALFIVLSDSVFIPTDPRGYIALIAAAFSALNILFLIDSIVLSIEFWVLNAGNVFWVIEIIVYLFSGFMIPLVFLPDWLQTVAALLPFKYVASFPVDAFMGRLPWNEVLAGLAIQVVWTLVLIVILTLIWRRGIKRFESFSG